MNWQKTVSNEDWRDVAYTAGNRMVPDPNVKVEYGDVHPLIDSGELAVTLRPGDRPVAHNGMEYVDQIAAFLTQNGIKVERKAIERDFKYTDQNAGETQVKGVGSTACFTFDTEDRGKAASDRERAIELIGQVLEKRQMAMKI